MDIHSGGRLAAMLQPLPKKLQRSLQADVLRAVGDLTTLRMRDECRLHRIEIMRQCVKRFPLQLAGAHAQAKLWRKAGGAYLAGTEHDGLHQAVLPNGDIRGVTIGAISVGRRASLHQGQEPLHQRLVDSRDPQRIETAVQHQRKELGGVHRLRRAGQNLQAHPLGQLAHEGAARRKTIVSQKCGGVNRID